MSTQALNNSVPVAASDHLDISIVAQRRDAETAIASADGRYALLQTDALGALKVRLPTPTTSFLTTAATTNATVVSAVPATKFGGFISNTSAAAIYLKFYNKASAPVVGTDVPVDVIPVAAGQRVEFDVGAHGVRFSSGISYAITAGAADTDTAAIAAGCKVAVTSRV